jgi:hypothetical protein
MEYQILTFQGISWGGNISTSYVSFGATTESEEPCKISLPASDGDLLYLFKEDGAVLYLRYNKEEGTLLEVLIDTSEVTYALVNGLPAYFELTDHRDAKDKFKELFTRKVGSILTLCFPDSITENILELLKEHESLIRGTGIFIDNTTESSTLEELISICKPRWIGISSPNELVKANVGKSLSNLELLWITEDTEGIGELIPWCKQLQSLIISEWEPSEGEILQLAGLGKLHTLTLADCDIQNLSNLEFPKTLKRLHLIGCEMLTRLDGLNRIPALSSLGLSGSGPIESLQPIYSFTSLNWLSLPSSTTQDQFNTLLDSQESLQMLEILNCPMIRDLSPLKKQESLKAVMCDSDTLDLLQLADLGQLELLILNSTLFEAFPDKIEQLKEDLPETKIVPGSGLCLGSGWLLLLLPFVLFFRTIQKKRFQKRLGM